MLPKLHFTIERWKYNPTFELWVSNLGHIRNKSKANIAPKINRNGYCTVYVYGSLNKYVLLHRIVMLTWRPTPEAEQLTVDHLDHNKRNNALSNLEWVTLEENRQRAVNDYINFSLNSNIKGIVVNAPNIGMHHQLFLSTSLEEIAVIIDKLKKKKIANFSEEQFKNAINDLVSGKNFLGKRNIYGCELLAVR